MFQIRILFWVFILSLALETRAGAGDDEEREEVEEVATSGGAVRGRRAQGGDYVAFLGIRYAAPPTGENRFKPSQPVDGWAAVQEERVTRCPQRGGGEEDCLQLHVFAPPAPRAGLPVLVHVHGGGFVSGSAPTEGLGPVVGEGVIVVSLNYRLGALGLLCLGSAAAPGNAALHDVVLALRWVRGSIAAFGGDPARVTLSGVSVGAAAAHLLALTAARDLFAVHTDQLVVCMDGSALAQFAVMPTPLTYGRRYGELLGCNATNISDLEQCFLKLSAETIMSKSMEFFELDSGEAGFAPCVERQGMARLLAAAPVALIDRFDKPVIFTFSNNEGSLEGDKFEKVISRYNDDFASFVPSNLEFPAEVRDKKINEIKTFYFGNGTITKNDTREYARYWGDNQFVYPALAGARAARAPAFLLEFAHIGQLTPQPRLRGAGHADIHFYLFPEKEVNSDEDTKIVHQLAKIIASFVKTGAPALAGWVPLRAGAADYLRLGNGTGPRRDPRPARMRLWEHLYRNYRRTDYTSDYDTTF